MIRGFLAFASVLQESGPPADLAAEVERGLREAGGHYLSEEQIASYRDRVVELFSNPRASGHPTEEVVSAVSGVARGAEDWIDFHEDSVQARLSTWGSPGELPLPDWNEWKRERLRLDLDVWQAGVAARWERVTPTAEELARMEEQAARLAEEWAARAGRAIVGPEGPNVVDGMRRKLLRSARRPLSGATAMASRALTPGEWDDRIRMMETMMAPWEGRTIRVEDPDLAREFDPDVSHADLLTSAELSPSEVHDPRRQALEQTKAELNRFWMQCGNEFLLQHKWLYSPALRAAQEARRAFENECQRRVGEVNGRIWAFRLESLGQTEPVQPPADETDDRETPDTEIMEDPPPESGSAPPPAPPPPPSSPATAREPARVPGWVLLTAIGALAAAAVLGLRLALRRRNLMRR